MDDKELDRIDLSDEKLKDFNEGNIEIASSEDDVITEKKKSERGVLLFFLGLFVGVGVAALCTIIFLLIPLAREKKLREEAAKGGNQQQTSVQVSADDKVEKLKQIMDTFYYEPITEEEYNESMYKGIVEASGDRYSQYYSAEELKIANEGWEGKFYGIGATLMTDPDSKYTMIESVEPGSPAKEAGLQAGDYIVEVDGKDVQGMELTDVVRLVRGDEGTVVKLYIARDGKGMDFEITRGEIATDSVYYEKTDDDIAYIAIGKFSDNTPDQFQEKIDEAKKDNVKAVIFDLRGNGGGGLDEVAKICDMFLPSGLVVYTEDKNGRREEFYSGGENYWDLPMVVLVNGGTASAAEIMTAAVKDMGVGTIVGTKTYGKGVYQSVVPLSDGSAVKVTNGKFYSPKGNCFNEIGIEPDVEVELDADKYLEDGSDNQLDKAKEILKEKISK